MSTWGLQGLQSQSSYMWSQTLTSAVHTTRDEGWAGVSMWDLQGQLYMALDYQYRRHHSAPHSNSQTHGQATGTHSTQGVMQMCVPFQSILGGEHFPPSQKGQNSKQFTKRGPFIGLTIINQSTDLLCRQRSINILQSQIYSGLIPRLLVSDFVSQFFEEETRKDLTHGTVLPSYCNWKLW